MSGAKRDFTAFWKQLYGELQSLSSEAKKRNNSIRQASDKSIEILKTVHSYEELSRHPDFVAPFILSCSSNNAKLTTISMHCLQELASTPCIPRDKLSDVLDAFIDATQLALEIKLKVLQVLTVFFKNYSRYVCGPLCAKLLHCCSNLLQLPNKSSMVVGTASATLQQLIDEIFERLSREDSEHEGGQSEEVKYEVLISNNESIAVDAYRYDANRLFADLCSSFDGATSQDKKTEKPFLDTKNLPVTYALEILESILGNGKSIFLKYKEMQFLLRIKTVPFLLRCISSGKHFPIVLRSFRCINLLIDKEYLFILELEMEVILSLLIHGLSIDSESPLWKRALSLELFTNMSQNFGLISEIFMTYDNFPDKKHICTNLLKELLKLLSVEDFSNCLCESELVERMDQPIVSSESLPLKTQYIHMLDKNNAPPVNITYIVWLILTISNEWSDCLSLAALDISQRPEDEEEGDKLEKLTLVYNGVFKGLFEIHEKFLFSTTLDTPLFHSLIRALQKLAHAGGILSLTTELNYCLDLFSVAIVANTGTSKVSVTENPQNTVFDTLSESLIGTNPSEKSFADSMTKDIFPARSINQRQVSLFRALISLSVSLGPNLNSESWSFILKTWEWISYYIYGPSADIMEEFYSQDVPPPPSITKNELLSIESSIAKLFESTVSYGNSSFKTILGEFIAESQSVLANREAFGKAKPAVILDQNGSRHVQSCMYNRLFAITQIGELAIYNSERFFSDQKSKETGSITINYMISLIADRDMPSLAIRIYTAKTFTDIIRKICFEVGSMEDQDSRFSKFNILEGLILNSILNCINALNRLEITKDAIYNGVVKAESEILLQLLSTLKDILNEFGDIISDSWSAVFLIINSPFDWLQKDSSGLLLENEDDSSLVNGIIQKYKDMVQVSYDVFKLISDDFLQSLPLEVIKIVIDTLINFVTQELNLNISFSSISQFWLVGDYLRVRKDQDQEPFTENTESEFVEDIKRGDLENVISSKSAGFYKMYNGLWLYLLKKLIECSKDKRIEVKNGVVQTFFRIVDSHASYFPDWNLIYLEVIRPLITNEMSQTDRVKNAEFWNYIFEGLGALYISHFADFVHNQSAEEQWIMFLDFMESFLGCESNEIAYVAIANYSSLLKSMLNIAHLPENVLNKVLEIWSQYNIVYSDLNVDPHSKKSSYDCVQEFISSFPYLYAIMTKHREITVEFLEKTLSLFNSAVRYPLLPENVRDNRKPSSLQLAVLNGLNTFSSAQKKDIEVLILFQLSTILIFPFETREKIEKKLLPKLPPSATSRIPTFEAVSVSAFHALNERLKSEEKWSFLTEKHTIKIMRNLAEYINRKPSFEPIKDIESPTWVSVSECFRDLSLKTFEHLSAPGESEKFGADFCSVFIDVATSPIRRLDDPTDSRTESEDIMEYSKYRDILLKNHIIQYMNDDQLHTFISAVWNCSFLYQMNEIENEILNDCGSLLELASRLSEFEFSEIAGSTAELALLSKYKCSISCLKDLVLLVGMEGKEYNELRRLSAPFLVSRIAFALRRYISNGSLVRRAPIPKIRKIELTILLTGLRTILKSSLDNELPTEDEIRSNLKILHPLILRTIQFSHKLELLQDDVLELSLEFTKLVSL